LLLFKVPRQQVSKFLLIECRDERYVFHRKQTAAKPISSKVQLHQLHSAFLLHKHIFAVYVDKRIKITLVKPLFSYYVIFFIDIFVTIKVFNVTIRLHYKPSFSPMNNCSYIIPLSIRCLF